MRILTIRPDTNRYEVQRDLKHFKAFSAVDAKITGSGEVQLKEVGVFERLKRAIVGNTKREKQSQEALLKLAEINPAIRHALGMSVLDQKSWSASELRARLDLPAERLNRSREDGLFHIQKSDPLGLANLRAEETDASQAVRWEIISKSGNEGGSVSAQSNPEDGRVCTYSVAAEPKEDELRKLYADVLQDAINDGYEHIALSPVPDHARAGKFHSISEGAFSDTSIESLLDAIDHARLNPSAPRVTITTDKIPGLADRIKDIDLRRKLKNSANTPPKESVAAMPRGLQAIADDLSKLPKTTSINDIRVFDKIRQIDNVYLYLGDPHRPAAETMILQFDSLHVASTQLTRQGHTQFGRVHDTVFDQARLRGKEAREVSDASRKTWGIAAIEIPSCEINTKRLFGADLSKAGAITADQAERFFHDHLQAAKGRVVIDLPHHQEARKGLLEAIRKFKHSDQGRNAEIVLATADPIIYLNASDELKPSGNTQSAAVGKRGADA